MNPSWEAVKKLPDQLGSYKIIIHEMPVVYEYVKEKVPLWTELYKPEYTIHVGVGQKGQVKLETIGHNGTYVQKDIEGLLPLQGRLSLF